MPHKRSTPSTRSLRVVRRSTPPAWRVLLQRALRARQAGEWQEVGRLLTLLDTAPDRPPADPPSRDVQAWGTLQADYWKHVAQDWQERARTAEEASGEVALVATVAREALQTLVRRVVDALCVGAQLSAQRGFRFHAAAMAELAAELLGCGDDHAAQLHERLAADVDGAASGDQQQPQRFAPLSRTRHRQRLAPECGACSANRVELVVFAAQPSLAP